MENFIAVLAPSIGAVAFGVAIYVVWRIRRHRSGAIPGHENLKYEFRDTNP